MISIFLKMYGSPTSFTSLKVPSSPSSISLEIEPWTHSSLRNSYPNYSSSYRWGHESLLSLCLCAGGNPCLQDPHVLPETHPCLDQEASVTLSCATSISLHNPIFSPLSRSGWPIQFTSEFLPCNLYLQEAALPISHSSQVCIHLSPGQLWDGVSHSFCVNSKSFLRAILHPKESAWGSAPAYMTLTFGFSWVRAVPHYPTWVTLPLSIGYPGHLCQRQRDKEPRYQ